MPKLISPETRASIEKVMEESLRSGRAKYGLRTCEITKAVGVNTTTASNCLKKNGWVQEYKGGRWFPPLYAGQALAAPPTIANIQRELARSSSYTGAADWDDNAVAVKVYAPPAPAYERRAVKWGDPAGPGSGTPLGSLTPADPGREFIDSADSWTIAVPRTLQKMAEMTDLNIEVRVWKKN